MGWNSYDYYDTTVTEEEILKNAIYMKEHLLAFGWEYVVVDIQWYAIGAGSRRDEYQYIPFSEAAIDDYSRFIPDPTRFPSSVGGKGFGPLADKIHDMGLKFGIHIMRGIPRICAHGHHKVLANALSSTEDLSFYDAANIANPSSICNWNPDMYGVKQTKEGQAYYDSLISLYASWGVDFIKCDDICNTHANPMEPYEGRHEIEMLASAISRCGRDIVLSLSPGPALIEQAWHYETYANMWRITDDFWDNWDLLKDMFKRCELWNAHVKEDCYPDCDMLPLGKIGKGFNQLRTTAFTYEEQKTMMTLWCLFGSPLMLGAYLPELDQKTEKLLTDQSLLRLLSPKHVPHQIMRNNAEAAWYTKHEETGEINVALFNLSDEPRTISISLFGKNFSKELLPHASILLPF